jgi:O-antigen/teichoic acid export membrane protein
MALKTVALMTLIMAPAILLAGLFARPFIVLCFGRDFGDAADALYWLLPGVFILSIEMIFRQMLQSDHFRVSIVLAWVATLIVNVCLNLWLIPHRGIAGAAMASSLSLAFLGALTLTLVLRDYYAFRAKAMTYQPNQ